MTNLAYLNSFIDHTYLSFTAICSPKCQNGGTCIRPNACSCPAGYEGDICAGIAVCSHLHPCYPGRCGDNLCMCSDGFNGTTCLNLHSDDFKPLIEKGNATFAKYSFTEKKFLYEFMTDATNMSAVDLIWTNSDEFNIMNFDIDASVYFNNTFHHIPPVPGYIRNMKFGIVNAIVLVVHYKLGKNGEYEVNRESFTCPGPSDLNPIADEVLECRMDNGTNVFQVDSGDRYVLTYTVTTGGYRELIIPDNSEHINRTEIYDGVSSQQIMEYRFDYDKPVHCQESNSCIAGDVPLKLDEDITKTPIRPKWSGWSDGDLSGVKRYAFEVWRMEYSLDYLVLREPDILTDYNPVPEFITEVQASNNTFPEYEPKEPGVYSTILEVADRANNSRYVRRIAIFDKTSEISIMSSHRLFVSSASNESNYSWQTTPNNLQTTTLLVQWENHFINEVHENGHFLARVQEYTPRLSDDINRDDYKEIEFQFDDDEGNRTKEEILNINSIVRFEINHGIPNTDTPTQWQNVLPIKENQSIELSGITIVDGDSYQVWVRATDVMGNNKIDSSIVHFDHSPPSVDPPKFEPNVNDGKFPFASRVTVSAIDIHSGISKVSFKFVVNRTGEVKNQKDFKINSQANCNQHLSKDCFCMRNGGCFLVDSVLDIDNCWLKVPIDRVEDEVHSLQVIVYNLAMLSTMTSYNLGKVDSFNGIKKYYSPSNITILKTSDTSLSISWIQAPTCYDRAGILIRLFRPDNSTMDFKVHKDATTFDLTGLSPTTHYWFKLFTKYGNDTKSVMSGSPAILKFKTAEASVGFPPGGVAGLSAGFILLLFGVVVVLLFLGRTGRLQPAKARMTQGIRTIRNTIRVRSHTNGGYNNRAYSTKFDDDIYFYGQMESTGATNLKISRKDISLESELAQGRFATIYLAKYYGNHRDAQTVAAKVLKDDQKEENVMKMKAKINFYIEKVGHHKNVMDFIGYVEDDVRGSFMVLEYCESGVLKEFLISKKSDVTVDLEERLFRMVFGVCLGMDYLSSKKVVHRRLAARNVLLDHLFEPKITGFGPEPDAEQEGEERIPLKWMAPECMKTTIRANELSDVFSFGIVMWEIFSLGDTPYPDIQSRNVATRLKQGYKMKKPEYCDDAFYKIMLKCWHYHPSKRSGFADVKNQLSNMFQEGPSEEYYYRTNDL
ncbi:uncharacterized protein LOC134704814 [Mytilus trossulus]|uniref:uncharacterized protein LOC134704814 n=1 Tax=Mytilus trossulus TaxID=6551 RepID=UPI003005A426